MQDAAGGDTWQKQPPVHLDRSQVKLRPRSCRWRQICQGPGRKGCRSKSHSIAFQNHWWAVSDRLWMLPPLGWCARSLESFCVTADHIFLLGSGPHPRMSEPQHEIAWSWKWRSEWEITLMQVLHVKHHVRANVLRLRLPLRTTLTVWAWGSQTWQEVSQSGLHKLVFYYVLLGAFRLLRYWYYSLCNLLKIRYFKNWRARGHHSSLDSSKKWRDSAALLDWWKLLTKHEKRNKDTGAEDGLRQAATST